MHIVDISFRCLFVILTLILSTEAIFMQNQIFANARKRRKEKKNVLFRKWGFTLFLMKLYIAFCIVSRLHDILAWMRIFAVYWLFFNIVSCIYILLLIRIYWYFSFVAFWCFILMKSNKNKISKLLSNDEKNFSGSGLIDRGYYSSKI